MRVSLERKMIMMKWKLFCTVTMKSYEVEAENEFNARKKLANVIVDGEYIDEERDVTLKWRGSKNQRVIDVQQSLTQNKLVLYCD